MGDPEDTEIYANEPYIEEFEGAARIFGTGKTFMDKFDSDEYAQMRVENLFYPFSSRDEWELASFLLKSNLSIPMQDEFLNLNIVSLFDRLSTLLTRISDTKNWHIIFNGERITRSR